MIWNSWKRTVEAGVDGEAAYVERARTLTSSRPECAAHEQRIKTLRAGAATVARTETIGDEQFPAFMAGIWEGIEAPQSSRRSSWATFSLVAAALVAALAMAYIFMGGPDPVKATEVEYVGTDLKDATVDWYNSKNGVVTIEVKMQNNDL